MKFSGEFALFGEALLRLFYPSLCASCRKLLEIDEKGLCAACSESLRRQRFLPSEERIRVKVAGAEGGWALFRYEGLVKDLLHQVKFERRRDLLHVFDLEMAQFVTRHPELGRFDLIVPVPIDFRRRLEREFNQSGLLAGILRRVLRIHTSFDGARRHLPHLSQRNLTKRRPTSPQSSLGREARRWNVIRAFRVLRRSTFSEKSVLLVDDIFTTGATLEEVTRTLRSAGAARVGYLTLARAMAG